MTVSGLSSIGSSTIGNRSTRNSARPNTRPRPAASAASRRCALRRRAHRREAADAAGLGLVFGRAEFLVERFPIVEDPIDESPETVMLAGIGKLLAPDDQQPIFAPAPRLEQDIETLHVLYAVRFVDAHTRPVEKIDVAALENRALLARAAGRRLDLGHGLVSSRARVAQSYGCCIDRHQEIRSEEHTSELQSPVH